jgi:hypothetical protein
MVKMQSERSIAAQNPPHASKLMIVKSAAKYNRKIVNKHRVDERRRVDWRGCQVGAECGLRNCTCLI